MRAVRAAGCVVAFAIIAALTSRAAPAMQFTLQAVETPGRPPEEVDLIGKGGIETGDLDRLRRALQAVPRHSRLRYLTLDSPGGRLLEGEGLATEIHRLDIAVTVPAGAECASACFLMFAAASRRAAGEGARIGVHSASVNGKENAETLAITTTMARIADSYGVPPAVLGKMVRTAPGKIEWLTQADLDAMNVSVLSQRMATPRPPFVAPGTPTAPASGAQNAPTIEFRGVYLCRGGPARLVLRLERGTDRARAEFRYGPTDANPAVPNGSFPVEGSFNTAAGTLDLRPVRGGPPDGYVAGLVGESMDGGRTFSGRVTTNTSCTRFSLRRVE